MRSNAARKKRASKSSANGSRPPAPQSSSLGWTDIYQAAERAGFEGYFWIPDLTPSEKMDKMTRRAIIERSDWLCDNCPPVNMAIDCIALDESGTGLWPKWQTGQDDFDTAMTDAYHYTNHDPRIFSADGRNNAYSVQYAIRRVIARYGDGFGQLLRPSPGARTPSHALFPGYIVDNFGDEKPDSGWRDGILCDQRDRAIRYRVLNKEHPTGYQDVEAADMLHYHDPFLPGQRRGLPALTPVCKKLFRMEDIEQAIADGTLSREMMGWAIENPKTDSPVGPRMPGAQEVGTAKKEDGSSFTVTKFFGGRVGRRGTAIPELPGGATFKMLESNRPGTAVMEFLDSILRQLAWARKYPPEYVFFNAGGQGTGWRMVLEKVKAQIAGAREFQLIPQFLNRWHVFDAWQRVKSGYFDKVPGLECSTCEGTGLKPERATGDPQGQGGCPECEGTGFVTRAIKIPGNWWKHKIVYPADITVDPERVLRIYAELASKNQMSIDAFHGKMGEDSSDTEDTNLNRMRKRVRKLKKMNRQEGTSFTYYEVWPPSTNAPTNNAAPPGDDEPPPAKPPPKKKD